jgi:hypothetical protein
LMHFDFANQLYINILLQERRPFPLPWASSEML